MTTQSCSSSGVEHHPLRLLIVDDNPDVLHDLRLLLDLSDDMAVAGQAESGQEAVRLAGELLPDVIVMDLEMPGMDGYEATRRIKSQLPGTRVIVLSIHATPKDWGRARAAGADGFVAKGSSYEVLRNAILGVGESSYSHKSSE